jgi:hypothetical protein
MWGVHSCPPKADNTAKLEVMPKRKAANKKKPAMDVLISSFMRLREEARQRMTPEEFEEAVREFHSLADKVRKRAGARPKSLATRPK